MNKVKSKHAEIVKEGHWTLKKRKRLYPEHTEHSVYNIFLKNYSQYASYKSKT